MQLEFLVKSENMYRVYEYGNPFNSDYYVLDAAAYLNNRGVISGYSFFSKSGDKFEVNGLKITNKNNYRVEQYEKVRVMGTKK